MSRPGLENIHVAVGDNGTQGLTIIRNALKEYGFRKIICTQKFEKIDELVVSDSLDLLICDVSLSGMNIPKIIHDLRWGDVGENPFPHTIAMISAPEQNVVNHCIENGFDDIIAKPFSPALLHDRLDKLIDSNRTFVVTTDYIGPDRRNNKRETNQNAARVSVPNIISIKADRNRGKGYCKKQINLAKSRILNYSLECFALRISNSVEDVIPLLEGDSKDPQSELMLNGIISSSERLKKSVIGTPFAQEDILIQTITDVAKKLRESILPEQDDIKQLSRISRLIRRNFNAAQYAA